jgi:hypothetical protein
MDPFGTGTPPQRERERSTSPTLSRDDLLTTLAVTIVDKFQRGSELAPSGEATFLPYRAAAGSPVTDMGKWKELHVHLENELNLKKAPFQLRASFTSQSGAPISMPITNDSSLYVLNNRLRLLSREQLEHGIFELAVRRLIPPLCAHHQS